MNHKYCYIICFMLLGLCTSCTTTYTPKIVKPYTTLAKIQKISLGMSVPELNQALDSEPAELYHKTAEGSLMIGYEYFTKDRVFSLSSSEVSTAQNDEASQTKADAGDYANAKYVNKLIAIFKDGKLTSILTADEGQYLMKTEAGIKSISKGDLNKLMYQNEPASEVEDAPRQNNTNYSQELNPQRVRIKIATTKFSFGISASNASVTIAEPPVKTNYWGFTTYFGLNTRRNNRPNLHYLLEAKLTLSNVTDIINPGINYGLKYYLSGDRRGLYMKALLGLQVMYFYRYDYTNPNALTRFFSTFPTNNSGNYTLSSLEFTQVFPSLSLGVGYMLTKNIGLSFTFEKMFGSGNVFQTWRKPDNNSLNTINLKQDSFSKININNFNFGLNFIFGQ